nr:SET and MYND domain-containing protein 5 [Leptinotarsa decemlineata]
MNVEVRVSTNSKGKCLLAKRAISVGSVIFEEDPLVSCQLAWNSAYHYLACDHCLRPLETAQENASRLTGQCVELPYLECCTTDKSKFVSCPSCCKQYCSEECRSDAFKQYHQTLCTQSSDGSNFHPLEQLNEAWKKVHYPPETNNILLITRLLARILQSSDKATAISQTLQFCHRTSNEDADLSHKLLGEKFADQLPFLHNLMVASIPHEGIEQFLTFEGFQSLLALIGTNGQGVGTSAISQWAANVENLPLSEEERKTFDLFLDNLYQQMDMQVGDFLNNEGVALYVLQSACNHSCKPNAEPRFIHNSNRLSLVATEDIEEGEEIFISYLDECMLHRSRHSRRKELARNYLFVCQCSKCEEEVDQPDVTSEEEEDESMSD